MRSLELLRQDPRVTVRRDGPPDPDGRAVVYWMQRAQRGIDNPALDAAIEAGNALGKPVVVFFGLVPFYPNANLRHYEFLVEGLADVAADVRRRRAGFVLRTYPDHRLERFCADVQPCLVVGDENPLREPEAWRERLAERLRVPLWTVDADVVVPTRLLGKEQYAARTIRPRITARLEEFLSPAPVLRARTAWRAPKDLATRGVGPHLLDGLPLDRSVAGVRAFRGGSREGVRRLRRFVRSSLEGYDGTRNRPELDATSRLSPYLHFGHLGPRQIALAILGADAPRPDRDAFVEQLIVRRELAVNFVRYNARYDQLAGAEAWARQTLRKHARDPRPYHYSERQLAQAQTHDPLWNAAQMQMVKSGWMHGYVRMYWAKKILEWTRTPAAALDVAIRLNDRYELDGRDPNGYANIAWAIAGKHDRAWGPERAVFGTIRYMSFESTSRKFDSRRYIAEVDAL